MCHSWPTLQSTLEGGIRCEALFWVKGSTAPGNNMSTGNRLLDKTNLYCVQLGFMSVSFYISTAYLGFKWNSSMVQHYSGLRPSDLYGHIQVDCRQNVDFDHCHWIPPLADSDYPTQPIFKFSPHYKFILSVSRTI